MENGSIEKKRIFALFPGQGSQKVGMGKDLYDQSSTAQEYFARADEALGFSLSRLCFEGPLEELTLTEIAQPAILTVSSIVYTLLSEKLTTQNSSNSEVVVAAGHSLGEYSALVAAQSLSFEDAVRLVHRRGKYMQEAVPQGVGKMVAVLGKEVSFLEEILAQVQGGVAEIANINAPGQVVISGNVEGVTEFIQKLGTAKVMELQVSAPFHCSLMKAAADKLQTDIAKIAVKPPKFPVYSNYLACPHGSAEEIKTALVNQVAGKVRWVECVQGGIERFSPSLGAELGYGTTLTGLMKRIDGTLKTLSLDSLNKIEEATA